MAEAVHLTPAGYKALEEKLEYLKTTRRAEIIDDIAVARSYGDLSENAEYDAAKNEQAHNELEIAEIEAMLKNAVIIDESHIDANVVSLGSLVRIRFLEMGIEDEYKIVGSAEADMYANPKRISNESPVGGGLLGKKVGEKIEIVAPGGLMKIEVLSISR